MRLKMISSPYCAVSEPNVYKHYKRFTRWNANRCHSLRITYPIFETFQTLFPTASMIFTAVKVFIKWYIREWSIKLRVKNGGWHETLNLLHVSTFRCKVLHFVTSYMKQNKSPKQTLERVQYGLEISFKVDKPIFTVPYDSKQQHLDKFYPKIYFPQLIFGGAS